MKVLCIESKEGPGAKKIPGCRVEEGKKYTVVDERRGYYIDGSPGPMCYELAELPEPKGYNLFPVKNFVPLSEIDEATFERNYQVEPVTIDLITI